MTSVLRGDWPKLVGGVIKTVHDLIPEGGMAVYSMVAYERVFFSHTYRVN